MSLRWPHVLRWLMVPAVLLASTFTLAAPVAEIAETRGAVSVVKAGGKRPVVSPQSTLDEGDIVITEANSTAVLAFTDGSKVALRPNTRFGIERYHYAAAHPEQDRGLFSLLAGGLRTLTGMIGKRGNPDSYRVKATTATIGVRGTEYTARLCRGDCEGVSVKKSTPTARVSGVRGDANVLALDGVRRPVLDGMALQTGEVLETGSDSWVGVTFSDDTRVVVRAQSALRIKEYRYRQEAPAEDSLVLEMLKGGLRALTGRMAKRNPVRVNVESVTATIGIRGTGFDTACVASGRSAQTTASTPTSGCGQGQMVFVREGRIVMTNQAGSIEIGPDETAYADSPASAPGRLPSGIQIQEGEPPPLPDTLPIFDSLPAMDESDGVYVLVHDGRVVLTQGSKTLEIDKGESAFAGADGSTLQKIDVPPDFLGRDPMLRSVNFDTVSCTLP